MDDFPPFPLQDADWDKAVEANLLQSMCKIDEALSSMHVTGIATPQEVEEQKTMPPMRIRPDQQVISDMEDICLEWACAGPFLSVRGSELQRQTISNEATDSDVVDEDLSDQRNNDDTMNGMSAYDLLDCVSGVGSDLFRQAYATQIAPELHPKLLDSASKNVLLALWPEAVEKLQPLLAKYITKAPEDPRCQERLSPQRLRDSEEGAQSPTSPCPPKHQFPQAVSSQPLLDVLPPRAKISPPQSTTNLPSQGNNSSHDPDSSGTACAALPASAYPVHSVPTSTKRVPAFHPHVQETPSTAPWSRPTPSRCRASSCTTSEQPSPRPSASSANLMTPPPLPQRPSAVPPSSQASTRSRFRSPGDAIRSKSVTPGRPRWQRWLGVRSRLMSVELEGQSSIDVQQEPERGLRAVTSDYDAPPPRSSSTPRHRASRVSSTFLDTPPHPITARCRDASPQRPRSDGTVPSAVSESRWVEGRSGGHDNARCGAIGASMPLALNTQQAPPLSMANCKAPLPRTHKRSIFSPRDDRLPPAQLPMDRPYPRQQTAHRDASVPSPPVRNTPSASAYSHGDPRSTGSTGSLIASGPAVSSLGICDGAAADHSPVPAAPAQVEQSRALREQFERGLQLLWRPPSLLQRGGGSACTASPRDEL